MRSTSFLILLTLFAGLLTVGTSTAHADTRVHYLYNDSRGTPVAAANDQGQVLWRKHYRPFGAEAELAGDTIETVADDRGFTGHTYDRESGLVYMGARHYNPQLGIFYGTDPAPVAAAVPLTFNRYIYANQNPYGYIDPNGQDAVDAGIGIVMGFVNGIGIMMAAAVWPPFDSHERGSIAAIGPSVHRLVGVAWPSCSVSSASCSPSRRSCSWLRRTETAPSRPKLQASSPRDFGRLHSRRALNS